MIKKAKAKNHTSGYDIKSLKLVTGHYWGRLAATAGAWFCELIVLAFEMMTDLEN